MLYQLSYAHHMLNAEDLLNYFEFCVSHKVSQDLRRTRHGITAKPKRSQSVARHDCLPFFSDLKSFSIPFIAR
jgi:hypothetical protein